MESPEVVHPRTFARTALEACLRWEAGDMRHWDLLREAAIRQGEQLRVERVPFCRGAPPEEAGTTDAGRSPGREPGFAPGPSHTEALAGPLGYRGFEF